MTTNVVGLFDSFDEARRAVQEMVDSGVDRDRISLVANDATGNFRSYRAGGTEAEEGAAAGAVGGGVIGGVLGLLVGVGALAIPGIGPVVAAGPLAAALGSGGAGALIGAGAGAATGGVIGALVGLGIPDEDAQVYAEGIRRGGAFVSVRADDNRADAIARLMRRHGVVDIDERAATWRRTGWSGFDANAGPYTPEEIHSFRSARTVGTPGGVTAAERAVGTPAFESLDSDYRAHFQRYAARGYTYDQYQPVYRYGYDLAYDRRYADRDWNAVESDARRSWEERNPGTWEEFKDAVRYAWDRARGRA